MSGQSNLDGSASLLSDSSPIAKYVAREHDDAQDAGKALLSTDRRLASLEGASAPDRPTSICGDGDASGMHENLFESPLRIGPVRLGAAKFNLPLVELDDLLFTGARQIRNDDMPSYCAAISAAPDEAAARPTIDVHDGYVDYVHHRYVRCWIDMRNPFSDYQSRCLSAKLRSDIRRQTKRFLKETGEDALDVRFYRTVTEISEFSDLAAAISATTFQERTVGCGWPRNEDFERRLLHLAGHDGCFGSIMFADQKPVSYQFMIRKNQRLVGKYIGFDPAFQRYSPGKIHMLSSIEHLFDDPMSEIYDFAGGGFRYMIEFSSDNASCADILRLGFYPSHLAFVSAHLALASMSKASTTCFDWLGLKGFLRKKLRGR